MKRIRIPKEHWERVWWELLQAGPITRVGRDYEYLISDKQFQMLRRRKLPFELVAHPNGQNESGKHA